MSWSHTAIRQFRAIQTEGAETAGANAVVVSSSTGGFDDGDIYWNEYRRSGGVTDNYAGIDWPGLPVHTILKYAMPYRVTIDGLFYVVSTSGAVRASVGHCAFLTAIDGTTLLGIGFRMDTDNVWRPFVRSSANDIAITTDYEVITAESATSIKRLTIIADGPTQLITWLINGAVVGTFSGAVLGKMTAAGTRTGIRAHVPTAGDGRIRAFPLELPAFATVERL